MLAGAAKMAADVKWCPSCLKNGVKSRVRVMQINLEEAVALCENYKCNNNATSTVILPRTVAKLATLKQRKKHRQNTSLTSPPAPQVLSPSVNENIVPEIPGSTNAGTVPSLRTRLWEDKVLQWKNKDALCWLDVSMCTLVHCISLRSCLRRQRSESLLKKLCDEFDRAQTVGRRDGAVGDVQDPQLHERTDHDRLGDDQIGVVGNGYGKGGGGLPPPKTTSSDLSSSMQYPTSLHPSLMRHLDSDAALEWLVMSDEECAKKKEQLMSAANKNRKQSDIINTPSQDAFAILEDVREKLWASLEPKLNCRLGSEESPVFALPLLARLSGAMEEHFLIRYRWEFFCKGCQHTEVKMCKKSMISLTSLPLDFTVASPSTFRTCPACNSPNQTSNMMYHSMPACMMFHFSSGVHNPDVMSYGIHDDPLSQNGRQRNYEVSCVIQYSNNPNHFIAWCRDVHMLPIPLMITTGNTGIGNTGKNNTSNSCQSGSFEDEILRDMWLKCNDLDDAVCEWQIQAPSIPASEIHIVMLERQGDPCTDCEAMNSEMTRIAGNVDRIVERVASLKAKPPTLRNGQNCPSPVITQNHCSSPAVVATNGLNSSTVIENGKKPFPNSTTSTFKHLGLKRSSFDSYTPAASLKQQTPNHLTVIDLDIGGMEETMTTAGGSCKGSLKTLDKEETWSRASSPLTMSSYRPRNKRSLPKYLQSNIRRSCAYKKPLADNNTPEQVQTDDASSIVTTMSYNSSRPSTVSTSTFGSSNVYARKFRPTRRVDSAGSMYFPRKTLYPGYSQSRSNLGDDLKSKPMAGLAAGVPEGAFVKYSPWKNRNGFSQRSSDRSTNVSPSNLTLSTKSLHAEVPNNPSRPRCDSLSSASSPSACSDLSSFSDNTSVSGSGKDDLTNTIDELYKVLDISTATTRIGSQIPSPTFDDDFLAEILADDPVPTVALPSTGNSVKSTPSKREPSVVSVGCVVTNQELDCIVPSIEPIEQGLLEKLVV